MVFAGAALMVYRAARPGIIVPSHGQCMLVVEGDGVRSQDARGRARPSSLWKCCGVFVKSMAVVGAAVPGSGQSRGRQTKGRGKRLGKGMYRM